MVSDIMNLHDSKEILTLSQHHETHDNPETQSQKIPHVQLARCFAADFIENSLV